MRVLLFGSTGGIGRHVREQARAAGHELVLLARDPARLAPVADGETGVEGDIGDGASVHRALDWGVDGVVAALGPTSNSADQVVLFESFAHSLVRGMGARGIRRLISISGAACSLPGERKPVAGRIGSALVRLAVRNVVDAKQRELEIIVASDLDWTLPRPARVVPGPRTGSYKVGPAARGFRVSQGDVADFMVRALTEGSYIREAPLISD